MWDGGSRANKEHSATVPRNNQTVVFNQGFVLAHQVFQNEKCLEQNSC